MKLYTIPEAAEYAYSSESKVRKAAKSGDLAGQIVAGTYVFSEAAIDTWLLGFKPKVPHKLMTVNTAGRDYDVGRNRLYTLIKDGTLPAVKIKARGSFGWAYVFYEADLKAVGKELGRSRSGPAVKDDIDKHIGQVGNRYLILGTKDRKGKPFSYLNLNQARRRAREAYSEPPLYKMGDSVFIKPPGTATIMTEVVLVEDVTWIDKAILVKYDNGAPARMPIRWLRSKK